MKIKRDIFVYSWERFKQNGFEDYTYKFLGWNISRCFFGALDLVKGRDLLA